jgi:cytochrome c oxidase subunit II
MRPPVPATVIGLLPVAILPLGALLLGACGRHGTEPGLSEAATAGRRIAQDAGCMSCHGPDGVGGVGPTWVGLAGSTVLLEDGRSVVADRAYLVRAIADPGAERVAGYSVAMPPNRLDREQVEAIVDYLEEL